MIRSGAADHLYDLDAQKEFFFRLVGPSFSQFLVWNHPPTEALLYLPLGFLTYKTGLSLMTAINSLLLWVIALWAGYRVRKTPDALFLLAATFFLSLRPASGTIATGQDSLWILLVLLFALFSLLDHRNALSALLLGLASLKFTIAFPLLFILLLGGFHAVVLDAMLAALLVWLVPIILFGPAVLTSYLRLCLELPFINGSLGMYSGLLWNFRGVLGYFSADPMKPLLASAVGGIACTLLVRRLPERFRIPTGLLVASFFSPHVYQHDALMYTGSVILYILAFYSGPHTQTPRLVESG